jgi:hypothetical protein
LINQAEVRQHEGQGTMFMGALMQHLVGAKLTLALPQNPLKSYGFSVSDEANSRPGDFLIEDVVIHVTTGPTDALLKKCIDNLNSKFRPIIVTTSNGVTWGQTLTKNFDIEGRVDFFDIEQFVAMNIYELSQFSPKKRDHTVIDLINTYNEIVQKCETDYSMFQIETN